MAITLKKVLLVLGSLALVGLLMFIGLIVLVVRGDSAAKEKATALCTPALVGASMDAALDRARKAESATKEPQWHESGEGTSRMVVTFPAALPLTGYLCTLSAKDGVVTSAEIITVD